jgi:hypothetical protein
MKEFQLFWLLFQDKSNALKTRMSKLWFLLLLQRLHLFAS